MIVSVKSKQLQPMASISVKKKLCVCDLPHLSMFLNSTGDLEQKYIHELGLTDWTTYIEQVYKTTARLSFCDLYFLYVGILI